MLKRGDKLAAALASGDEGKLADMGLRYDLTLPLSRYYAAHRAELPTPFKVIQTDRVYRAERPQKGRLREFVQCDIDILGDSSPNAEVELIDTTARALLRIGFSGFTVNINDRRILRAMLEAMGFAPDTLDTVCVSFDKLDKIGAEGVRDELTAKELPAGAIASLYDFLQGGDFSLEAVAGRCGDPSLAEDLRYVLSTSEKIAGGRYGVAYCPSLVRGQGYYTGMVFEVTCPQFSGAVAGGGRYDNMVGKFIGQQVPAVGFSIGFERGVRHPAGTGLHHPRRQAPSGTALPAGSGFCPGAGQGGAPAGRLRRDRPGPGQKAGQAVRHPGGSRLSGRRLRRQ